MKRLDALDLLQARFPGRTVSVGVTEQSTMQADCQKRYDTITTWTISVHGADLKGKCALFIAHGLQTALCRAIASPISSRPGVALTAEQSSGAVPTCPESDV